MGSAPGILAQLNSASVSSLPPQFPPKRTLGLSASVFLAGAGARSEMSRPRQRANPRQMVCLLPNRGMGMPLGSDMMLVRMLRTKISGEKAPAQGLPALPIPVIHSLTGKAFLEPRRYTRTTAPFLYHTPSTQEPAIPTKWLQPCF